MLDHHKNIKDYRRFWLDSIAVCDRYLQHRPSTRLEDLLLRGEAL